MNRHHTKHCSLIDRCNSQETIEGRAICEAELKGFRCGWSNTGEVEGWQIIAGDQYQIGRNIDRPMCGGVFLDWSPASAPSPTPCGGGKS